MWICTPAAAVESLWWQTQLSGGIKRRPWLGHLYSDVAAMDWEISGHVLRPPKVVEGKFVHLAPPAVLKWTARARSGALATRARLFKNKQSQSPQCPGCGYAEEDDLHVLTGCPATGSADCTVFATQHWTKVGQGRGAALLPLPATWVHSHLMRLSVAFVPLSLPEFIPPHVKWLSHTLLKDFHMGMVTRLAEVLRRRECLISAQSNQAASSSAGDALPPSMWTPPGHSQWLTYVNQNELRLLLHMYSPCAAPSRVPLRLLERQRRPSTCGPRGTATSAKYR